MAPNAPNAANRSRYMVCNCQKTMDLDSDRLMRDLSSANPIPVFTELCRGQIDGFKSALRGGEPLIIACTQEAPLFTEIAAQSDATASDLTFVNIRENAGWCTKKTAAQAKISALLAEAQIASAPVRTTTLKSDGICLVYGRGQQAVEAAVRLSKRLSVTLLLADPADAAPPATANFTIAKGRIRSATGRLGAYDIEVDGYAAALPSSRKSLDFELARNGAKSRCDLIVDLSGNSALFPSSARRDGYLRAMPTDRAAIAEVLFTATDLVGEFEKPIYVAYDAAICAHTRSGKAGCSKCLDVCPTGAITPSGDHVAIDAAICAGCGTCAAVCPTGAASYSYPSRSDVLARLQTLLGTYRKAGGTRPIVLVFDDSHGRPMIDTLARERDGLPPNVLPFAVHSISSLGHDLLAAAIVSGAEKVVLLGSPLHTEEHPAIINELSLLNAILTGLGYAESGAELLVTADPDELAKQLLSSPPRPVITTENFLARGTKRDIARTVMSKLHAAAPAPIDWLPLPKGAPYGKISIDAKGCTLCLACVGACPANALADNPERPELAFTEAACVQCGICVATCPENVISLAPGYDFTNTALTPAIMKTEEPFHCVSCDKPFGTKSTIDRVVAKLQGRHSMFQNASQVRLIQMCDNCRVIALSEGGNDPMRLGTRPRVRTTEDYLNEAKAEAATKSPIKKPDDFLS